MMAQQADAECGRRCSTATRESDADQPQAGYRGAAFWSGRCCAQQLAQPVNGKESGIIGGSPLKFL